jgi:hypothetical protein
MPKAPLCVVHGRSNSRENLAAHRWSRSGRLPLLMKQRNGGNLVARGTPVIAPRSLSSVSSLPVTVP